MFKQKTQAQRQNSMPKYLKGQCTNLKKNIANVAESVLTRSLTFYFCVKFVKRLL